MFVGLSIAIYIKIHKPYDQNLRIAILHKKPTLKEHDRLNKTDIKRSKQIAKSTQKSTHISDLLDEYPNT